MLMEKCCHQTMNYQTTKAIEPSIIFSILQPCDVAIFRHIKSSYKREYEQWKRVHNNRPVSVLTFLNSINVVEENSQMSIVIQKMKLGHQNKGKKFKN